MKKCSRCEKVFLQQGELRKHEIACYNQCISDLQKRLNQLKKYHHANIVKIELYKEYARNVSMLMDFLIKEKRITKQELAEFFPRREVTIAKLEAKKNDKHVSRERTF